MIVPPLRTSQKPSTHRRMKPGASSRTPETVLLLQVKIAGVHFTQTTLKERISKSPIKNLKTTYHNH